MGTILNALSRFEALIMGCLAAVAILLAVYEVAARYLMPSMLTDWGGEVIVYLVICAVLLGGGSLVSSGQHVRADLFIRKAPKPLRRAAEISSLVAGLAYCGIIAWYGVDMVEFARMIDIRSDSSLQFPQWIFYSVLPVAFVSMALRFALLLWRALFLGQAAYPADPMHGHSGQSAGVA